MVTNKARYREPAPLGANRGLPCPIAASVRRGGRQTPSGKGSAKIHSCHAHMAPARSLAEALIPFMFLLAVLVFGILFLSSSRKTPEPEAMKASPSTSGVTNVTDQASDRGK